MASRTRDARLPHRWLWLALPDDYEQEVALSHLLYPRLTEAARREHVSYRLRLLRHEVWDRYITRRPRVPPGLRPSKLARRTGYRRNHGHTT